MIKDNMVYIVAQTQTNEDIYDLPIYVMTVKLWADKYAQKLNKEYAYGVDLDKKGNFIKVKDGMEQYDYHFYRVLPMVLDEELAFEEEWCKKEGIGKHYKKGVCYENK